MKSAKTKIVFGVLDLVAAGYAVWACSHGTGDFTLLGFLLLMFPLMLSVPIALYNLRPLIKQTAGRWELWICAVLALAGIGMPNIEFAFWIHWGWRYGGLSTDSHGLAGPMAMNLVTATGLVIFLYSLHWGVPCRFLCPVALRCGAMPLLVWFGVAVDFPVGMLGVYGLLLLYLTETILYLRTGWKERTPREAI